jgi:primosomal protein N'
MFASVIPSIRLPRGTGVFDYAIPDGFARFVVRGSTVVIPWRGRKVDGLVLAVSKTPAIDAAKVKPLIGITALRPLPEDAVDAIEWMSERCLVSPGTVVLALVPQAPKRRRIIDPRKLDGTDAPVITKPVRRASRAVTLRRYATAAEKLGHAADVARDALAANGSAIIVTPHLADVAPLAELLRERFGDAVVELRGDLAATKLWTSWERALADTPTVVVGTRMAVMAPVARLAAVVVLEADSPDLKQYDQNPRFDARTVALRRATVAGASAVLMSRGPRAEDYALREKPGHAYVPADTDRARGDEPDTVLADIAGSAKTDEEKVLTPSALDAVSEALQSGKRVLLFHNRRGNASAVVCADCKHVFRCPSCGVARTAHGTALHCHDCGTPAPVPEMRQTVPPDARHRHVAARTHHQGRVPRGAHRPRRRRQSRGERTGENSRCRRAHRHPAPAP